MGIKIFSVFQLRFVGMNVSTKHVKSLSAWTRDPGIYTKRKNGSIKSPGTPNQKTTTQVNQRTQRYFLGFEEYEYIFMFKYVITTHQSPVPPELFLVSFSLGFLIVLYNNAPQNETHISKFLHRIKAQWNP